MVESNNKPKRKLSQEAKEVIQEETSKQIDKFLTNIKEDLSKMVAEHLFMMKENSKKSISEDKREMTDYILKKYIPLKRKLKVIKNTLLTEEEEAEAEEKTAKSLMETSFKETTTYYEESKKNYEELSKIFKFIDNSINDYKSLLEERITNLEEINKIEKRQKNLIDIQRHKNKIYILENYYKKGQSAKEIKLEIYDNERKFCYDRNELLEEMSEYFTNFFTIIDVFS